MWRSLLALLIIHACSGDAPPLVILGSDTFARPSFLFVGTSTGLVSSPPPPAGSAWSLPPPGTPAVLSGSFNSTAVYATFGDASASSPTYGAVWGVDWPTGAPGRAAASVDLGAALGGSCVDEAGGAFFFYARDAPGLWVLLPGWGTPVALPALPPPPEGLPSLAGLPPLGSAVMQPLVARKCLMARGALFVAYDATGVSGVAMAPLAPLYEPGGGGPGALAWAHVVATNAGGGGGFALSPDGTRLWSARASGVLLYWVYDAGAGGFVPGAPSALSCAAAPPAGEPLTDVACSGDGAWLAAASAGAVLRFNANSGECLEGAPWATRTDGGAFRGVAFPSAPPPSPSPTPTGT
jgi:hypothetical protein